MTRDDAPVAGALRYLTFDSLSEGVGASQVLPYVERLAALGVVVELHTFEKSPPTPVTSRRLSAAGVHWYPHDFGRPGSRGGAARVARGAQVLRGADLVHARSDLAAASAMLSRSRRWVWDVRSLFADQRIALGAIRAGSAEERALRAIEAAAARRSSAITALSAAAIDVLASRYGDEVRRKASVVPTCVDLDRFAAVDLPPIEPAVQLLISGTLNNYYDLPTMLSVVEAVQGIVPATVEIAAPGPTAWDDHLRSAGLRVGAVDPGGMAERVGRAHAGLSICRFDAGPSLAAAVPTKIAEFLAVGRPVVVNAGLGDFDSLLPGSGAGVVLADSRPASVRQAAEKLVALLADPETPQRCRRLAVESFDVAHGVLVLREVYARISR